MALSSDPSFGIRSPRPHIFEPRFLRWRERPKALQARNEAVLEAAKPCNLETLLLGRVEAVAALIGGCWECQCGGGDLRGRCGILGGVARRHGLEPLSQIRRGPCFRPRQRLHDLLQRRGSAEDRSKTLHLPPQESHRLGPHQRNAQWLRRCRCFLVCGTLRHWQWLLRQKRQQSHGLLQARSSEALPFLQFALAAVKEVSTWFRLLRETELPEQL
mmetsp:Transcript_109294/g.308397  ORF Transcript_109294/g.308397 Transcript_109294/m.308397 type:complete len:216 (+) Transcript_109294:93-740(+)